MDPERYASMPVKSDAVFNITRTQEYCDPQYRVESPDRAEATGTGHLEILRIKPVSGASLPSFSARWDNKAKMIDIDLIGPDKAKSLFIDGLGGYQGHHPTTVSTSPRIFHIEIRIPDFKVYEANITCNVNISARLSDNVGQSFSDSVDRMLD
jgi:hypothetical protein